MSHRYTREEKGKGLARSSRWTRDPPVRLPPVENADLIEDNRLTLIGRVMNPKIQRPRAVISFMPQLWGLSGKIEGKELGHERFRFKFESEDYLQTALRSAPFRYKRWMLAIQRWEPVISDSFPCCIPIWITIHALPLHYWKADTLKTIVK